MPKIRLKSLITLLLSMSLLVGAVLTGACATPPGINSRVVEDYSARRASALVEENRDNPGFVILDVRTPEEFDDGHIETAINIDFYADTFRDELDVLDKDKIYLLYCRSGNRSGQTTGLMDELGFTRIDHLTGGIIEWKAEGLPIVR